LSVKTRQEQRQTAEADLLLTKVMLGLSAEAGPLKIRARFSNSAIGQFCNLKSIRVELQNYPITNLQNANPSLA
jgi:hypothetical protein